MVMPRLRLAPDAAQINAEVLLKLKAFGVARDRPRGHRCLGSGFEAAKNLEL